MHAIHTGAKPGTSLRAKFRIRDANERADSRVDVTDLWDNDDENWTRTETVRVNESGQVESLDGIQLPIPDREGSFELSIELSYRLPLVGSVAKRTIPFVVIDPRQPPHFGSGEPVPIAEFNPADPNWRDYLSQIQNPSNLLPGRKRGPWSNLDGTVRQMGGGHGTSLPVGGWVAYSLSGAKVGVPHILEVEFPPEIEQDVGVSFVDPKADRIESFHGDAGITIGDRDLGLPNVSGETARARHRVVFWPKSSSPVVVISNKNQRRTAVFGRLRLEAYPQAYPSRVRDEELGNVSP